MKIYTKTGDKGKTSLFGGERVDKNHDRLNAYGTSDELNSILGICISHSNSEILKKLLTDIQHDLFNIGAVLATPTDKRDNNNAINELEKSRIEKLESIIDDLTSELPELREFILPGGSKCSSFLHFARTVCRRLERLVVALSNDVEIDNKIIIYLNRLSDLLFVLARYENFANKTPDITWQK